MLSDQNIDEEPVSNHRVVEPQIWCWEIFMPEAARGKSATVGGMEQDDGGRLCHLGREQQPSLIVMIASATACSCALVWPR
jgi:hypothetical protein